MSLICLECECDIISGMPLFSVDNESVTKTHSAICSKCLNLIPENLRVKEKSKDHQVCLHQAKSNTNFNGSYSLLDFEQGEVLGYLPDDMVKEVFPNVAKLYLKKKWTAHQSKPKCECDVCQGRITKEELLKREKEVLEEYGWLVHFVGDDPDTPINIHTHGFQEKFGQLDMQIVLPIPPQAAHGLLCNVVKMLENGTRFNDGDVVQGICSNDFSVKFVLAKESNRDVLRIVLPDREGHLDYMTFDEEFYNCQYAGIYDDE